MGSITDLKLNYIMFKSAFDKMIVLHHNNTKIGGGLLTPSVEYFGLFGNGEVATPFIFKPTTILHVNEVECLSWKTIKAIKNKAGIESTKDAFSEMSSIMRSEEGPTANGTSTYEIWYKGWTDNPEGTSRTA